MSDGSEHAKSIVSPWRPLRKPSLWHRNGGAVHNLLVARPPYMTWEGVHMTDSPVERTPGVSESDTRTQSDGDCRPVHSLTIEDLDRAAAAAVDLDDPEVTDGAWR